MVAYIAKSLYLMFIPVLLAFCLFVTIRVIGPLGSSAQAAAVVPPVCADMAKC